MNCQCDHPARYLISRDSKPCYTCALGRCRLYALAPVQSDGYTRITLGAPGCPPADTGVVLRFEALAHPSNKDVACFMIRVQGDPSRWGQLRLSVLQDPQYEGMWYTAGQAFLYPMSHYQRLLAAVKACLPPGTAVEEIPGFYLRCVERMQQLARQYDDDVAAGRASVPDTDDYVFRRLKPFQRDGVRFVLAHHGRAMIADDMGLGKTVQAIAVAHHYRSEWPVLVVCPMSLVENWAKEFNKFCSIPFARIAILQGAKATATSLQDVVIVSYSSLKCVEHARFDVVILDESHYIKAGAAKRAQQSLKLCRDSRRAILLSGTPAMSRPVELYAQLQAIQPGIIPSKAQFGARYCNSFVSRFGIDFTGHSHADELQSLLRHYLIRRTKRELGDALPSKSRQLLYVCITEKEKKAFEKQVIALRRSLSSTTSAGAANPAVSPVDGGVGVGVGGGDLAARAPNAFEMKMATARAKIPAVQDYVTSIVEQHLDSGDKLILFAHHQCMMEALRSAVEAVRPREPIDYIYISGDTPPAQREPAAEHFRTAATCTVAILSMQSSGTGHNFTCASTVVFTELDWNPSTHLQCEDRVHRIGQAQPCHIKYLLAEGTSDSVIWPLLQTKLSVTTALFETPNATGAERHLHDGADKHNVARRDVVPTTASSSTPSTSQQSTLDRFMPAPPRPSQAATTKLKSDDDDDDVSVVEPSPRHSCAHSQSAAGPPEAGASPARAAPPLPQRSSLSFENTSASPSERYAAVASPAPPPVISFAEMKDAFATAATSYTVAAAAAAARRPRLSATTTTTTTTTCSSNGGGSGGSTAHPPLLPSASCSVTAARHTTAAQPQPATTTSTASVIDLMRQTASVKSSPVVVDLTSLAPPLTSAPPPQHHRPAAPVPLPETPFHAIAVPTVVAAAVAAAPARRTVFTLSHSRPPPVSADVVGGVAAAAAAVVAVSAAPQPPPPPPPEPAAERPEIRNVAVHVPLRPNLHLKRPRVEAERLSGSGHVPAAMPAVAVTAAPVTAAAEAHPIATAASPTRDPRVRSMEDPIAFVAASSSSSSTTTASPPRRTCFTLVRPTAAGSASPPPSWKSP
ncbi:Helicase-like protein [Novymonas esmeraldas]|uniref:Helicase-like protein n=1 Tax=Novymonas esmeraldas TaxID=1808958 RepID=A0AAW0EKC3_9TRYP